MGSLALRPGNSLTILVDGCVNGLQDCQFPSFLPFKLQGLDSCPGMAPKLLNPEGRASRFQAKAAWSDAWTDAAQHFGGVGAISSARFPAVL